MRVLQAANGLVQILSVADLCVGGVDTFLSMAKGNVKAVYSDPPWNPGNEKYWRRYAGKEPPKDYNNLLDAWCLCAASCGAKHIFCEQSISVAHRDLLLVATKRCPTWRLPLLEEWVVQYGSPRRPNKLLHFGEDRITTDPTGMSGEAMTRKVFEGVYWELGDTVADPCMGLGTTSRVAARFGLNCVGIELNPKRLERTIMWLRKHVFEER